MFFLKELVVQKPFLFFVNFLMLQFKLSIALIVYINFLNLFEKLKKGNKIIYILISRFYNIIVFIYSFIIKFFKKASVNKLMKLDIFLKTKNWLMNSFLFYVILET